VIVRKFGRDWQAGYADPQGFAREGRLELLDLSGTVVAIGLDQVKRLSFVREFLQGEDPERLVRRSFASRPRAPGVWLRLRFRDGEEIEGLANNDASLLEGEGIQFAPPDLRSNTQRMFVPRVAIESLEIVAVIHASGRRKGRETAAESPNQEGLFPK
jgi:hypothetical protein